MAPPRGRRRKAAASSTKPAQDDTISGQIVSDTASVISSINPKDQGTSEQTEKSTAIMDIDDSVLQSSDNSDLTQPATDADSQLLYEGDDGLGAVVSQEMSYAPEDVEALLGDDDNEILDNTEGDFSTSDESKYTEGEDDAGSAETGDSQGEDAEKTDITGGQDAKAKAKLVKTTYHYITDKTEEKGGKQFLSMNHSNFRNIFY